MGTNEKQRELFELQIFKGTVSQGGGEREKHEAVSMCCWGAVGIQISL
jgi:hypothetical protein